MQSFVVFPASFKIGNQLAPQIKRYIAVFLIIVFSIMHFLNSYSFLGESSKQNKVRSIQYDDIAKRLDEYLKREKFNGSVLITHHNHVILNKGYGLANFEFSQKNLSTTKHYVGSITKNIIAIAILQLQAQGKLNIHNEINCYIPFFENKNITLYQLLTHTSGIVKEEEEEEVRPKDIHLQNIIKWIAQQRLAFEPGERWMYSNYNYTILAYIIEKVTAEKLDVFLQRQIFSIASMNNSGIGRPSQSDLDFAKGYKKKGTLFIKQPEIQMNWLYGSGNLYTTVQDVKNLNDAILAGKLLSKNSLKLLLSPFEDRKVSFGLFVGDDYYHNHGIVSGWNCYNNFTATGINVILFSNVQNGINNKFNKQFRETVHKLIQNMGSDAKFEKT
ncbi:serine hydrolase domain-containing protein [Bacillus thuringiensis]|uniref:serine hydrolase domain-containing protein n=1 Tax=Bacillus thuringiensis TaxID=1428 RepID=UPI0034584478